MVPSSSGEESSSGLQFRLEVARVPLVAYSDNGNVALETTEAQNQGCSYHEKCEMLFLYLILQHGIAGLPTLRDNPYIPDILETPYRRPGPERETGSRPEVVEFGEELRRDSRSMESKIFALRDKEMVDYSKRTIENITKYIQSLKEEKRSTISSPHHRTNHRRDRRIHQRRIKRGRKSSPKPGSPSAVERSSPERSANDRQGVTETGNNKP